MHLYHYSRHPDELISVWFSFVNFPMSGVSEAFYQSKRPDGTYLVEMKQADTQSWSSKCVGSFCPDLSDVKIH